MDEEGKVGCGKDTQRLAHEILAKEIEKGGNGFCEEPLKVNLLKGFEVGMHELLEDKIVTKADT